jgi:hypothetical protein
MAIKNQTDARQRDENSGRHALMIKKKETNASNKSMAPGLEAGFGCKPSSALVELEVAHTKSRNIAAKSGDALAKKVIPEAK